MKFNQMNNKLKFILNKITAAANDEINVSTYLANPLSQDTNLNSFLGKWLPGYALAVNFTPTLTDDATILYPDLDAPTDMQEYLGWLNGMSVCKLRGEGEFLEAILGFELYAKLYGLIPSDQTERNEPPIPLMEGANSFSPKYLSGGTSLSISSTLEEAGKTLGDLEGLSLARLRLFICKLNFPGKTPEQAKQLKIDLVKNLYDGVLQNISEIGQSGRMLPPGIYPAEYNGVTIGYKLPFLHYPNEPFFDRLRNPNLAYESMNCAQMIGPMFPVQIAILLQNQVNDFIVRRTIELLRRQADIYFALLVSENPCYSKSENLTTQEKRDCIACGELVNKPKPPEPEIENSPLIDVINTIINTGVPLGGYGLINRSNRGPRKN